MPFEFVKFIDISPMYGKGWMTRSLIKVKIEEIGLPPTKPTEPSIHPHSYNDIKKQKAERDYTLAVKEYLSKVKANHKEEILDLVMREFHELLLDLNSELEIEPELEVMRRIMDYSPTIDLPRLIQSKTIAYFDTTVWIYDSGDPLASTLLRTTGDQVSLG